MGMRISIIQMDIVKGCPDKNFESVTKKIEEASASTPDVILLPEMWNTSYSLENISEIGILTEKNKRSDVVACKKI